MTRVRVFLIVADERNLPSSKMVEVPLSRVGAEIGVPFPSPQGGEVWSTIDTLVVPRVLRVLVTTMVRPCDDCGCETGSDWRAEALALRSRLATAERERDEARAERDLAESIGKVHRRLLDEALDMTCNVSSADGLVVPRVLRVLVTTMVRPCDDCGCETGSEDDRYCHACGAAREAER